MIRLATLFRVRSNELLLVGLITGLMFFAGAGGAIGSPGIEALFYTRFGVQFLPVMYIILGVVTMTISLLMTGVLARTRQDRLYVLLPLVLALVLVGARLLLLSRAGWIYPILWLGMNVLWVLQGLANWGLAGLACDTRQAKRLFPLFGVGGIIGLTTGSLLTRPVVVIIGTKNLILVWAAGLLVAFILARRLASTTRLQVEERISMGRPPGMLQEAQEGLRIVRRSPLLRWMALAAVLFAVLYYALVFPFAKAVTVQFPDENEMAAFLGTFQGVATGAAILASLLLANRLYAAFGFMTTILVYPLIYLAGFSVVAAVPSFAALVAFRFVQTFWSEGVAEGASQAMFNVVPADRRDKARTFIRGVANQLGVSLAGLMLLLSDRVLANQHLFFVGVLAAAVTAYFVWKARQAYGPAVVAALRAGQSHIFFAEDEPFGGFHQDATAVAAALAGINSQDVAVRRIAVDILGNLSLPEATNAMVAALGDEDASVRAALLRALGKARATPALLEVAALLDDPDPTVRLQAMNTLGRLTAYPRGLGQYLEPLLADVDPAVRSRAAARLLQLGDHPEAEAMLKSMASAGGEGDGDPVGRIAALEALADWGGPGAFEIAAAGLTDPNPAVRRASATVLAHIDAGACVLPLRSALGDEDAAVREAAAEALGHIGQPALNMVVSALNNSRLEGGALLALALLPARQVSPAIRAYAGRQSEAGQQYHRLWLSCCQAAVPDGTWADRQQLLADALQDRARYQAGNALQAIGTIGNTAAVRLAIDNLDSHDANQRANAMETLDSLGESAIVRPLLPLWEFTKAGTTAGEGWLLAVLQDGDPWLRACAAFAAPGLGDQAAIERLAQLAQDDPETLVRQTAAQAHREAKNGDGLMETLQSLSIMERVLFLRRVPLFTSLPPNDLKQIAAIAGEERFSDGVIIARQGERGDKMFMIVDGEVQVSVASDAGGQEVLGRRGPGEYVGEMAILSDEVRMASLTAAGEVHALCIGQRQFTEILRLRPETSLAVMRVLCQRLRERDAMH